MGRVKISRQWKAMPVARQAAGVLLIYIPIIFLPFVLASAFITYAHLRVIGAKDVKRLRDFMPDRKTCRYHYHNQILPAVGKKYWFNGAVRTKLFWVLNCTAYCPFSVALLSWHAYLVKLVENFWCPFNHNKKCMYMDGPIDKSYWHMDKENAALLHPDDRDNPLWNDPDDHPIKP